MKRMFNNYPKKKIFIKAELIIVIIAVFLWTAFSPALVLAADVITFPDPKMEAAVRSLIKKPTGDIDTSMVQNITQIDFSYKGIQSIEGLQYFTSLQVAWLYNNEISDITPLRGLTRLNTLGLCNNQVSNISALSGLTQLTFLSLFNNRVHDISALENLNKLTTLKLDGDPITDYSPIYDIYGQLKVKDFSLPANYNTANNSTADDNSQVSPANTGSSSGDNTDTSSGDNNTNSSLTSDSANTDQDGSEPAASSNQLDPGSNSSSGSSTMVVMLVCLGLVAGGGWIISRKKSTIREFKNNSLFSKITAPQGTLQADIGTDGVSAVDLPIPFEAYIGNKPYIFVSYAHVDGNMVFSEINELHKNGYRIWYDEGIDPGNEWPVEIAKALDAAACFMVFISESSINSKNVRNEINFALNRGKPFFAVYLKDIKLPPGLELRMGDIQAILKWRMSHEHYMRTLQKALPQDLIDK